jgi:hypothetical protein
LFDKRFIDFIKVLRKLVWDYFEDLKKYRIELVSGRENKLVPETNHKFNALPYIEGSILVFTCY